MCGAALERGQQHVEVFKQNIARAGELYGKRGIEHIGAGHALMQKPRLGADMLGDGGQEGDDVMLGGALDFIDAGHVEAAFFPDGFGGFFRNHFEFGQRVAGMRLDVEPDFIPGVIGPDIGHFGAGIARYHAVHHPRTCCGVRV